MSPSQLLHGIGWSALTVGVYLGAVRLQARVRHPLCSPLLLAPSVLLLGLGLAGVPYASYRDGAGWLTALLGPATLAFAVPVYEQRALLRRHAGPIAVGALLASAASIGVSYALAGWLGLDEALRRSLLPRSVSTPFAMEVSAQIGGVPELTAVFVVFTGVLGAAFGEWFLARLKVRSKLARGAAYGAAAHGAGTAKAYQLGETEGAVAALLMVVMGLLNVLCAPWLAALLPG